MLKKWLAPSPEGEPARPYGGNHSQDRTAAARVPASDTADHATSPAASAPAGPVGKYNSFEQIYQSAAIKPLRIPYSILKVAEMMNSPHLAMMSPETKRGSLLMALEAAGAAIEEILQDAAIRQRALADYEDAQHERLKHFEQSKAEENQKIQAELDRLIKLHQDRIQANLDEVAREQDAFRAWQKSKQQEAQRLNEAVAYCVPQSATLSANNLAGLLERVTPPSRTSPRNGAAVIQAS